MPTYDYGCSSCGTIEIFHSMMEDNHTVCPECGLDGLIKQVTCGGGVIVAGRAMNQYNDVKQARYWRDKNGVRHKVTSADGHTGASTVTKQTASPLEIAARKKADKKKNKKNRVRLQEEYGKTKLNVARERT